MATSSFTTSVETLGRILTIHFDRNADKLMLDQISDAFKAAGEKFVAENAEKIMTEINTERIERYVAEYIAKNLELKLKEKDNA